MIDEDLSWDLEIHLDLIHIRNSQFLIGEFPLMFDRKYYLILK